MRTGTLVVVLTVLLAPACVQRLHRTLTPPDAVHTVDRAAPFLKVHMRDGALYVLSPWTADEAERTVSGTGTRYGADRRVLGVGAFDVEIDDVALFETNVARPSPSVAPLAVITGISAALTVYCLTNTKACFGSCPTFYVTDGDRDLLQAEGFSASIAPRLEATDVDHLYRAAPRGRDVRIHMVNEAYETHVVRHANLLAVPRVPGLRVFKDDDGGFWHASEPSAPASCTAPEGDCRAAVAAFDGVERWSEADSADLAAREHVELTFDSAPGTPALVVASRQTLLPTYLLYQAFAYLGSQVGEWLAAFERADGGPLPAARAVAETIGGIDVLVPDGRGGWTLVETILETGPLAADVRLVRLPATEGPVRVRLALARGAWRLDWVGLAALHGRAEPIRFEPAAVVHGETADAAARSRLIDPDDVLVTFPGDRYTLEYRLPEDARRYELFLESRGYYLEWMREEWLAEENLARAAALFLDPAAAMRRLAPEFKKVEAQLDSAFWRSRYAGF